jgi:uncharacterized membrane protein
MRLHLRHRPVLLLAGISGTAVMAVLARSGFSIDAAALIGWCAGVLAYLVPTLVLMTRATPQTLQRRAEQLDESEGVILLASLAAAVASLGAVIWFLAIHGAEGARWQRMLPLASIVLSWSFVHVMFAVRYAHGHWRTGAGLRFAGDEPPVFADFLYAAFTIGIALETSDVTIAERRLRRVALAHMIISFLFNVVIIATAVNVAADLF